MRGLGVSAMALPFFTLATAFDCKFTASGVNYDLSPLGGLRTASSRTETPPTQNEARVRLELCGDGVGKEDGLEDEDQVSGGAVVDSYNVDNYEGCVCSVMAILAGDEQVCNWPLNRSPGVRSEYN